MNHAPDIEVPTSLSNTLTLVSTQERIVLVAWDQDGDDLEFFWGGLPTSYAGTPVEPVREERDDGVVLWLAGYDLPWNPSLDGRTLECVVSDLEQNVTVRWTLQVEEQ